MTKSHPRRIIPPFSTSVFLVCAVLGPIGLVTSHGCAHARPEEKQVERRIAAEPEVKDRAALEARNTQTIENAGDLTFAEREKLLNLRDTNRARIAALTEESLKIRSLLVKDLVNPDYDPQEVALLKKKLKDTESKKVAVYFEGLDQANTILGRENHPIEQRERIIRDFMEPRAPRVD